ncbi:hypothetical protein Tco_0143800 [Tanacetum coccineum]
MNITQAQQKALDDALVALRTVLRYKEMQHETQNRHQTERSYISSGAGCSCSHSLLPCIPYHYRCSCHLYARILESICYHHQQVSKWQRNWNGQDSSVPCLNPLGKKAKGLVVLSEVALTKAEQLKLATERSKTQFHSSHTSGSGDRVDTQSKVSDEQQQKSFGTDEGTGDSEDEDDENENDYDDLSDEGDDDNDGNNGNDDDDDDANDDDEQEGDDTINDDEETDSDRTEPDNQDS